VKNIEGLTAETARKWSDVFMNGCSNEFTSDDRGGKRGDSFYDIYPDIEADAIMFAIVQCNQKVASFTAFDLAQFIDKPYNEVNHIHQIESDLVRSVKSCRLDLRRWGARFDLNSTRPYFEGHERPDAVAHHEEFIHHF
jgi:hypothetical protein